MSLVAKCDYCGVIAEQRGRRDLPPHWKSISYLDGDTSKHWCTKCDPREEKNEKNVEPLD